MPKKLMVLTAKKLEAREYNAIHSLPRGFRNETLRKLLSAAADLAEENPEWYRRAVATGLKLRVVV